jgi:hypothetical protein
MTGRWSKAVRGRIAAAISLLATGLVTSPARADDRPDCGLVHCVDLGLRTGVGVGFGSITEGQSLAVRTGALLSVGLDAGYRIGGIVTVGASASYGRVALKKSALDGGTPTGPGPCFEGTTCSASLYRFGLDVRVHFLPRSTFDPWVGVGAGYEILTISESGQTASPEGPIAFDAVAVSLRGMEYGRLEVGLDARVTPSLSLGPIVAFSVSRYGSSRASGTITVANDSVALDTRTSREIVTTAPHEWLVFGVRGAFELGIAPR